MKGTERLQSFYRSDKLKSSMGGGFLHLMGVETGGVGKQVEKRPWKQVGPQACVL